MAETLTTVSHTRNGLHFSHSDSDEENGDYNQQQWQHNENEAFSLAGSVASKDFEGEKEFFSNAEKLKEGPEKISLVIKDHGEDGYHLAEARQPLWRKVSIPSSLINPYRIVIILRFTILVLFFQYRISTPVHDAFALWIISVICEIWLAFSWMLDQLPKWFPITRETYLDRLSISAGAPDKEGKELPQLVYISREKRLGYKHHRKAGAMNALVRVSAVLSNAPFLLNLDCDQYINNSKVLKETMCFLMDPQLGKKLAYVQFPRRFDGIDCNDRYANHNTVLFDINMKGLDGIQGPVYVGTGCVFNRQALYGYKPLSEKRLKMRSSSWPSCCCCSGNSRSNFDLEDMDEELEGFDEQEEPSFTSKKNFEKRFGQSPVFIASTLMEDGGLPKGVNSRLMMKEAIHVISCGFEEKTEWGKEIGWLYGSVTEDILTGFNMHCRGWKSVYCMPERAAFKGSAPINLSDRLHQVLKWALGSTEIFFSGYCPLWYGYSGKLKWLQRLAYTNAVVYPFTSIPLLVYCTIPAVCLLTGKFIMPTLTSLASIWLMALFICIILTCVLELRWSGVSIQDWWRNEQFWVIGGVSAHLFAVFQGLLKVAGIDTTNFAVREKTADDTVLGQLYLFKWTTLLIPPTSLVILNMVGIVAGISDAINNGYDSWGPLFGKLFFSFWVIVHLYPFLKGLMGRQNRTPTIVVLWSILLALIFSMIWVRFEIFLPKKTGPVLKQCGVEC
ncbi:unnamed protein product [Lupinus luteus]|uniref:Cellulose synthase n=1 Tax=Lupinus luteus TaxID=3873 RepID=A0AAV1XJ03_LUPLU